MLCLEFYENFLAVSLRVQTLAQKFEFFIQEISNRKPQIGALIHHLIWLYSMEQWKDMYVFHYDMRY